MFSFQHSSDLKEKAFTVLYILSLLVVEMIVWESLHAKLQAELHIFYSVASSAFFLSILSRKQREIYYFLCEQTLGIVQQICAGIILFKWKLFFTCLCKCILFLAYQFWQHCLTTVSEALQAQPKEKHRVISFFPTDNINKTLITLAPQSMLYIHINW